MLEIKYPIEIKNDKDKLHAVYSLLEQMRLEHNRVGAIARSDWKNYQGKWIEYAKLYAAKQLPLLEEQNRLKEAIKKVECPDWDKLSDRDKEQASNLMYGDKVVIRAEPTLATSDLLNELKIVSLDKLASITIIDPPENFTGYTEVDPDPDDITVSASKIDCINTSYNTSPAHYVYKDFTADHFDALDVLFEQYVGSATTGDYVYGSGIGFSDGVYTFASPALRAYFRRVDAGPTYTAFLVRGAFDAYDSGTISVDTLYYCKLGRAAASDTAVYSLYTDSGRTSLHDALTTTGFGTAKWRYIYGLLGSTTWSNVNWTGYVQNMDLQEAGGLSIPVAMHHYMMMANN